MQWPFATSGTRGAAALLQLAIEDDGISVSSLMLCATYGASAASCLSLEVQCN